MPQNKEYIERQAVIKHLDNLYDNMNAMGAKFYQGFQLARHNVNDYPAADVVEVRHGRWERVIPTKSAAKWSTKVSCSQCHGQGYERYNYCPHCGALMDKEE